MIEATNLKAGKTVLLDGKPYKVIKYTHQKIARGGGTVKVSIRNLESGLQEDKTLSSSVKVEEIDTRKRPLQFLYQDDESAVFMDSKSFEQVEIPLKILGKDVDAEELYILTEVEKVALNFNQSNQINLDEITLADARKYLSQGHFPSGSMGPKIEAAIYFLENGGEMVCISSVEKMPDAIKDYTGTRIVK